MPCTNRKSFISSFLTYIFTLPFLALSHRLELLSLWITVMLCPTLWESTQSFTTKYIICGFSVGFPGHSDGREATCNEGDLGLIPRLGRSPRGGHGNPLQYSGLENPHGQRSLARYRPWGHKELGVMLFIKLKRFYSIQEFFFFIINEYWMLSNTFLHQSTCVLL